MPTYGRPDYVNEAVQMFIDQDYPHNRRELIILNDCPGQTFISDLPSEYNIKVFNESFRYKTLGQKRNVTLDHAKGDLIAIWDDDDLYLPWRLSFSQKQMEKYDTQFYRALDFWTYWGKSELQSNQCIEGCVVLPIHRAF